MESGVNRIINLRIYRKSIIRPHYYADARYIKHSVGGWIGIILLDILLLLVIFWYPIFVFLFVPNYPDPELPIGYSVVVSLLFLHNHFIGIDTFARIELNKYLKAQSK